MQPPITTPQEDEFEGVKVNVHQILGDISASFSDAQMDMLFSKFQAAKSRSVPDTLLLLELCKRLAESDAKVCSERHPPPLALWCICTFRMLCHAS
jgi:hypothetical protein